MAMLFLTAVIEMSELEYIQRCGWIVSRKFWN